MPPIRAEMNIPLTRSRIQVLKVLALKPYRSSITNVSYRSNGTWIRVNIAERSAKKIKPFPIGLETQRESHSTS